MSRKLSSEERELWDRLRRSVRPLSRRRADEAKAAAVKAAPPEKPPGKGAKPMPAPASHARAPAQKPKPAAPSLARFEEKTLRRLSRGLVKVDDRIDLHGMRQERAHSTLGGFLRRAQARGDRIVLIVTGKGFGGEATTGESSRGVLRQSVPHWLAHPEFREFVSSFEEAARKHGGAGALYVRIRRRREARFP